MSDNSSRQADETPKTLEDALSRIAELEAQLEKALFDAGNLRLQLDMFSITDTVTGLRNINGLVTALERAAERARRSGESFALMSVEFDSFAAIAAEHGSQARDDVVRHAGSLISACIRRLDTVGRIEDTGFHVVLPMMDENGVEPVVNRMSKLLSRMPFEAGGEEYPLDPMITILLSNPAGTNDVQRMVKELATARERAGEVNPLVVRSMAVVEKPEDDRT